MNVRILIADDHSLVRRGLRALIEGEPGYTIVGEAVNGEETIRLVEELRPEIVLLDISMPGVNGIEITRTLHTAQPALCVLILTVHEDQSLLREAFAAGAMGYIVKRAADDELIRALQTVVRGELYIHPTMTSALIKAMMPSSPPPADEAVVEPLTPRELEVLRLLAQGYTNREVAQQLNISIRTAEGHRANLMDKLGISSRLDLVEYAKKHALL
jgi:two-component system, NarL family, response regulator NreC